MQKSFWQRMIAKPWVRAQLCAMTMGSVLLCGGGAYAAHRVNASAVELGSEILSNVAPLKGAESVSFNGAHFYFANQIMNAKLDVVLAGAESICKKDGADLKRDLGPTLAQAPTSLVPSTLGVDLSTLLTSGKKTEKAGEVACWVRRRGADRSVMQRISAFAESMDMSEFGSLQFIHAEAFGPDKTMVRMVWSEGKVSVRELFPEHSDVPGHDLPELPRPVGSFRVVSAHVHGAGHDLVSYQSQQTPEQLEAFYATEMKTRGWEEIDLGERTPEEQAEYGQHAYRKANRAVVLALTLGDQLTDATFIEMPTH